MLIESSLESNSEIGASCLFRCIRNGLWMLHLSPYQDDTIDDITEMSLIMSKVRVVPLKKVTLPRLEFLAAVLMSRLIDFVKSTL